MQAKPVNMDEEKKSKIVAAAIIEFAQNGYGKASTNTIVKEAGISKGLLFHYFGSKKGLFSYVFDYCTTLISQELFAKIDPAQTDILAKLRDAMFAKITLSEKFPQIFYFVQRVYLEGAEEIKSILIIKEKEAASTSYGKMFEGIDYGLFRDDIDVQKSLKIIYWTLERFGEEVVGEANISGTHDLDYQSILAETDDYLMLFRKCFYHE